MASIAVSSVEDAVMLLHDPRNSPNADEIAKAVGICAQVRESWDGLQLSLVLFNQSARPQVKFWCLSMGCSFSMWSLSFRIRFYVVIN